MPVAPGAQPSTGSNQYSSYPNTPGIVPTTPGGSLPVDSSNYYGGSSAAMPYGSAYQPGNANPISQGFLTMPTFSPYDTAQYSTYMQSQIGKGIDPFNLSTSLPSSGQATQPGQLNAPMNDVYQQLQQFLTGAPSSMPGASQATQMAQTGNPVDQTAAWQAMIASQGQNTANNATNLREQFAGMGALDSSPFGAAMQQFYNQNTLNQNQQLTSATATAQENAQNRELQAQQGTQALASGVGSNIQTIDQSAINNMLQEFNYTQAQNNPLNAGQGQLALSSPNTAKGNSVFNNINAMLGTILSAG